MEMYDLTLQPTNDAIEIQGMMVPLKSGTEATMTGCVGIFFSVCPKTSFTSIDRF